MDSLEILEEDGGLCELDKLRLQNRNKMINLLEEEFRSGELADIIDSAKALGFTLETRKRKPKKKNDDGAFIFGGIIPTERKRSARLAKCKPEFNQLEEHFDDEDDFEKKRHPLKMRNYFDKPKKSLKVFSSDEEDLENLENVVSAPAAKRRSLAASKATAVPFKNAEDVTEADIRRIAKKGDVKVYDGLNGTCCHQCRQKTKDMKTYCRSGKCIGIRGMFCGVCLLNRYGEDAATALKDPTWSCPPCRNLCNCSICRSRQGKRPTGILAPIAQREGFKSVKDFLKYLQSFGSHVEPGDDADGEEVQPQLDKDTIKQIKQQWAGWKDALRGFDQEGNPVFVNH